MDVLIWRVIFVFIRLIVFEDLIYDNVVNECDYENVELFRKF